MVSESTHSSSIRNGENQSVEPCFRIFVYGSLKKGYALHHLLEDQRRLPDASTKPLYRLFDLGSYPGLIEWPEGLEIFGEVYEINLFNFHNILLTLARNQNVVFSHKILKRPMLTANVKGDLFPLKGLSHCDLKVFFDLFFHVVSIAYFFSISKFFSLFSFDYLKGRLSPSLPFYQSLKA